MTMSSVTSCTNIFTLWLCSSFSKLFSCCFFGEGITFERLQLFPVSSLPSVLVPFSSSKYDKKKRKSMIRIKNITKERMIAKKISRLFSKTFQCFVDEIRLQFNSCLASKDFQSFLLPLLLSFITGKGSLFKKSLFKLILMIVWKSIPTIKLSLLILRVSTWIAKELITRFLFGSQKDFLKFFPKKQKKQLSYNYLIIGV